MSYAVVISSRAEKEITSGWKWYEERQQGLGDRFVAELMKKVESIQQNPGKYKSRHKNYRETALDPFPYLLIYRFNKSQRIVRIVAVFHTSMNPVKKYNRQK